MTVVYEELTYLSEVERKTNWEGATCHKQIWVALLTSQNENLAEMSLLSNQEAVLRTAKTTKTYFLAL